MSKQKSEIISSCFNNTTACRVRVKLFRETINQKHNKLMGMYEEVKLWKSYGRLNQTMRAKNAFSPSNTERVLFCEWQVEVSIPHNLNGMCQQEAQNAIRDPVARCSCWLQHRIYTDYWAAHEQTSMAEKQPSLKNGVIFSLRSWHPHVLKEEREREKRLWLETEQSHAFFMQPWTEGQQ